MANERLTLQIDTVTTGTQNVDALTNALNKVVSISDRTKKSLTEGGETNPFHRYPEYIKHFVEDPLSSLGGVVEKNLGAMGAIGGAGLAAGVGILAIGAASLEATRSLAELGLQTQNIAIKTGLTNKEVGQFSFAAKAAGADIDVFQGAMRKLSQGLVDGGEEGKKASAALRELGVTTRTINGDLRPTSEIFAQIGDGLNGLGNVAERNTKLVALFGKAGIELAPTLLHLRENLSVAKELGLGLSDAEIEKFRIYKEQLEAIDARWDLLSRKFKEGIAGTITLNLLGRGEAALEWLIGDHKGAELPTAPSTFLTKSPVGPAGSFSPKIPWREIWGQPGPPPNTQLSLSDALIYGSLLDPERSLGLSGPATPGLPPGEEERRAAVAKSLSDGRAAAEAFSKSRQNGTPEGIQARITELEGKNANIAATLSGDGMGLATVNEMRGNFNKNQASIDSLKAQLKSLEAIISQAAELKKRAQEISYDGPFTKLMNSLVGGNKNPGSAAFGDALKVGAKLINDEAAKASKLPLTLTELQGTSYINEAGQKDTLRARPLGTNIEQGNKEGLTHVIDVLTNIGDGLPMRVADSLRSVTVQDLDNENLRLARETSARGATGVVSDTEKNIRAPLREQAADQISSANDLAERRVRLAAIGTQPGDELKLAQQQYSIRAQMVDQDRQILESHRSAFASDAEKLELDRKLADLDKESQDATLEYMSALAEHAAKQKEEFRNVAGSLFDAATSGNRRAIPDFVRSQALNLGRTVTENAAGMAWNTVKGSIPRVSDPESTIGKLLKGTPFGADPLKVATDLNTAATIANTTALARALATSPTSGGGGIPSAAGSAAAGFGSLSSSLSTDAGNAIGGDIGDGLPMSSASMSPTGALAKSAGPVSFGSSALGKDIGLGAAAAGGGFAAFSDFKSGGAKNDIAGAGALLGSGAAIAAMFGPAGAPVALGLGIAAMATSLIAAVMPDPHVVRENAINKALAQNQYVAPQALNVTQDSSGNFSDFDARGNLRSSNFSAVPSVRQGSIWEQTHGIFGGPPTFYDVPGSQTSQFGAPTAPPPAPPVTNIYVSAIDAPSFHAFAQKNAQIFGNATAKALQDGHGALATEVQRTAGS